MKTSYKEKKDIEERKILLHAIQVAKGNIVHAQKMLGITTQTIYYLIKKHKLFPELYMIRTIQKTEEAENV